MKVMAPFSNTYRCGRYRAAVAGIHPRFLLPGLVFVSMLLAAWPAPGSACNPEPGPAHFQTPALIRQSVFGYFEAFTTHDGLPSNDFLCIAVLRDQVAAGSTSGLVLFSGRSAFRVIDSPKILPSLIVTAICGPDRRDRVYIGTTAGLVVADTAINRRFNLYTSDDLLPSNTITCLYLEENGDLWVGTDQGLIVRRGDQFDTFTTEDDLPSDHILSVGRYEDEIIIGTVNGPVAFSEIILPAFTEYDLRWVSAVKSADERLYLGCVSGIFHKEEDFQAMFREPYGPPSDWVTAVELSREHTFDENDDFSLLFEGGTVLAGMDPFVTAYNQRAANLEARRRELISRTATLEEIAAYWNDYNQLQDDYRDCLQRPAAKEMQEESEERTELWAGTKRSGLGVLSKGKWIVFNRENSRLTSNQITGLAVARDNSIWIATMGGGINRYGKYEWSLEQWTDNTAILKAEITVILPFGQSVYVGTAGAGLFRVDTETGTCVSLAGAKKVDSSHITCLGVDRDGNIFIGTEDRGLYITDGQRFYRYTIAHGLGGNRISSIFINTVGRVYVGCENKSEFIGDKLSIFLDDSFFTLTRENMAALKKGNLENADSIMRRLEMNESEFTELARKYQQEKKDFKLPATERINAIKQTDYYLLLGTDTGLFIYDGEDFFFVRNKGDTSSASVKSVAVTSEMIFYLATSVGLLKHDGKDWNFLKAPVGFPEPEIDGVITDDINPTAVWFWSSDRILGSGLGVYDGTFKARGYPKEITAMALDDPYLWIGTSEGLFMIKKR